MSVEVICVVLTDVDDEGITGGVSLEGVFKMRDAWRGGGTGGGAGAGLRGGRGGVLISALTLSFDPSVALLRMRNGLCVVFEEWN